MAIFNKGILGGFSGKAGPVTGSRWRGLYILKTRSRKKIKKRNLLPQNFRIRVMSKFLGKFTRWIKIGFYDKKNKEIPYNVAIKLNMQRAIFGESPNYEINYKKIIFSKGSREPAWSVRAILEHDNQIKVTWEIPETAKLNQIGNDQAIILVYDKMKNRVMVSLTAKRVDLAIAISVPIAFQETTLEIWMFFVSPDGKSVSNTDYAGSVSVETEEKMIESSKR